MDVLFAADDSYARHLGVTMLSLLRSQPADMRLDFHLLHQGMSAGNLAKLASLGAGRAFRLHDYRVDPAEFSGFSRAMSFSRQMSYITLETFFRLKAHRILPDLARVLYLDTDIICRADLSPLWSLDLDGKLVAAVANQDVEAPEILRRQGLLGDGEPYFNAGVLLLNLAEMRTEGIDARLAELAERHGRFMQFADQDLLNVACRGRIAWAPLRFNVQSGYFYKTGLADDLERFWPGVRREFEAALADPAILHFTGREKPWHITSRHPMRESYREIERASPWRDEPLLVDHLRYRPHPARAFLDKVRSWFGPMTPGGGG